MDLVEYYPNGYGGTGTRKLEPREFMDMMRMYALPGVVPDVHPDDSRFTSCHVKTTHRLNGRLNLNDELAKVDRVYLTGSEGVYLVAPDFRRYRVVRMKNSKGMAIELPHEQMGRV